RSAKHSHTIIYSQPLHDALPISQRLIKGLIIRYLEFPGLVPYDENRTVSFLRMSTMTITLKPDTERLINEELKLGHYKDAEEVIDRKSTRLNSSHLGISYAVFCL